MSLFIYLISSKFFAELYLFVEWLNLNVPAVCVSEAFPLERVSRVSDPPHPLIVSWGQHARHGTWFAPGVLGAIHPVHRQVASGGRREKEKGPVTGEWWKNRGREGREVGHVGTVSGEKWSIVDRHGNNADRSDTDEIAISRGRLTDEK